MRIVAILFALFIGVASAERVFAHASPVGSEPAAGTVLAASPRQIILRFNEPVSALVLRLIGPDGSVSGLSGAEWAHDALAIPVPSTLTRGTHVLSWRIVSLDGHPVGGTLAFSVIEKGSGGDSGLVTGAPGLGLAIWTVRLLFYCCLFGGVGVVFFRNWFAGNQIFPASFSRTTLIALVSISPIGIASIGLLGLDALASPWAGIASSAVWRAGLFSSYTWTISLAVLASLAAFLAIRISSRLFSGLALAVAAAAIAASGHAATASPQWLSRAAVFVHAACIMVWIGALPPLLAQFRAHALTRLAVLQRFSSLIRWPIVLLVLSGAVLSFLQLRPFSGVFAAAYTRVLILKLMLVAILLGLAAFNRYRLTPRIAAGETKAARSLVRSIQLELLIVLLILATVALWRFTPPPRSLVAVPEALELHLHDAEAMAHVIVSPGRPGANSIAIALASPNREPLAAKEVRISATNEAAQIEPVRCDGTAESEGRWTSDECILPLEGNWVVQLDILISDFKSVRLSGPIKLRRRDQ